MSKTAWAHGCLFVVGVIYALNYIVAKGVMPDYIGPSGFIFYRVLGATVLFWLVHRLVSNERVHREDYPRLIQSALFGVCVNMLFFFNGLNLTTPVNASIIMTTNPVLVLLAASLVLKEALTKQKVIGIGLGISGSLLLILFPVLCGADQSEKSGNSLGDFFILINAITYAIYLISLQPLMTKYQPLTVIKWVFTFGSVMVLPFSYDQALAVDWAAMPTSVFWSVVFVVVCVTFIAYFLNINAMQSLSPSVVSVYIYLQPVLAVILSVVLGMSTFHWTHFVAAAMVFTGVYLVSIRRG